MGQNQGVKWGTRRSVDDCFKHTVTTTPILAGCSGLSLIVNERGLVDKNTAAPVGAIENRCIPRVRENYFQRRLGDIVIAFFHAESGDLFSG